MPHKFATIRNISAKGDYAWEEIILGTLPIEYLGSTLFAVTSSKCLFPGYASYKKRVIFANGWTTKWLLISPAPSSEARKKRRLCCFYSTNISFRYEFLPRFCRHQSITLHDGLLGAPWTLRGLSKDASHGCRLEEEWRTVTERLFIPGWSFASSPELCVDGAFSSVVQHGFGFSCGCVCLGIFNLLPREEDEANLTGRSYRCERSDDLQWNHIWSPSRTRGPVKRPKFEINRLRLRSD